jgi:uracil-DNA glycosylase
VDSEQALNQIASEVRTCTACNLHYSRKNSVPGEGPVDARIMFIGEGPGMNENEQGRPFVGAAGKLLEDLLAKAGLHRKDVFICNVVKCRPPGNRDPMPDEMEACGRYLDQQIEVINPQVIVTLGRFSMGKFLPGARISSVHGQAKEVDGRLIVAMFHPAAALHQPALKPELERDFANLPKLMTPGKTAEPAVAATAAREIRSYPELVKEIKPVEPDDPKQMNLF